MNQESGIPDPEAIPVSLFIDYNCPFCYVALHRLERIAERHPLDLLLRFVEIHPGNDPAGQPLETLGYPPAKLEQIRETTEAMVAADALPWQPRRFTTNTRRALLLAQAVQLYRRERLLPLSRALFHAYFAEGRNIGDPEVLKDLAEACGVSDLLQTAWQTSEPVELFLAHVEAAREHGLTGVPSLVVSGRAFNGAVSADFLEQALMEATSGQSTPHRG